MYWGIAQWVHVWCVRARCAYGEQPDVYVPDFYDARFVETCLSQWGSEWRKRTLLFYRGARRPEPLTQKRGGSLDWHARRRGGAEAQGHARDATPIPMAKALAAQCTPDGEYVELDP